MYFFIEENSSKSLLARFFAGPGVLNKDPTDGARPANTIFPRDASVQQRSVPAPKNKFASIKKSAKLHEITFLFLKIRERV